MPLRPKVDNIVLIGQYKVGHGLTQFQQLVSERLTRNLQEDQNTLRVGTGPIELGLGGVCGREQVKRSWKSAVGHEMNVILSLKGRM